VKVGPSAALGVVGRVLVALVTPHHKQQRHGPAHLRHHDHALGFQVAPVQGSGVAGGNGIYLQVCTVV
jgi:hypothetical protein